ncbi:uncharacterized protein LOC129916800 [Episyrphus balteatus]|uniref:uncharacterized protein LOC129916800 n=1 Tax=Episyrphus balteatus TaxID=286459 RepID=UPI002485A67B|nr:uncharacterized protein LOC129916800 [Episyrphus balteatus]
MKFAIVLFVLGLVIVTIAGDYTHGHNGQSACEDPREHNQKFQNNNDPTKYWTCDEPGKPATQHSCEDGTAYQHAVRNCVPWGVWKWNAPVDPISMVM